MKRAVALAGILLTLTGPRPVAADGGAVSKCGAIDLTRFWVPPDMDFAMEEFVAKARQLNASGTCVVDGWFGRNENRFYMTVVPPGYSQIGKVISFSLKELREPGK